MMNKLKNSLLVRQLYPASIVDRLLEKTRNILSKPWRKYMYSGVQQTYREGLP